MLYVLPLILLRQKFFNKDGNHSTKATFVAVFKVLIFEGFIQSFNSIVSVYTNQESFLSICPYPSLKREVKTNMRITNNEKGNKGLLNLQYFWNSVRKVSPKLYFKTFFLPFSHWKV